jgi:hypothetical protein
MDQERVIFGEGCTFLFFWLLSKGVIEHLYATPAPAVAVAERGLRVGT